MFGFRSDGRKLKTVPPFFRVIPNVMLEREDSQVYFKQDIILKDMDEYIDKKAKEGIRLSYMNIIYAALVRIVAERPYLNRFAMNGSLYARNKIYVSLAIKKTFSDEGQETTIKLPFNGNENIFEIKEKLDNNLVVLSRKEVQEKLCLSDKTVTKAFKQLTDCKLIYEKRQGANKPNLIYVGKMQYLKIQKIGSRKNYDSGQGNITNQESENLRGINTNNIYTNKSGKKSNSYIGRKYTEDFFDSLYANKGFSV